MFKRVPLMFAAALGAASLLSACDKNAPPAPAAPTPASPAPAAPVPPAPVVESLRINGLPSWLSVGQSVQLAASETLSDGREKTADDATWESSNAFVATISSGTLRVTGFGGVDITARASEQAASVHVDVVPETQTFSGSLCPSNRPAVSIASCSTNDPQRARVSFPVSPDVPVVVNMQFSLYGDYFPEFLHFTVSCGTTVVWDRVLSGSETVENQSVLHSGPVAIVVAQPCAVQVDVFDYMSAFKSQSNRPTQYRIDVTHRH
jgi:hypothetical protein